MPEIVGALPDVAAFSDEHRGVVVANFAGNDPRSTSARNQLLAALDHDIDARVTIQDMGMVRDLATQYNAAMIVWAGADERALAIAFDAPQAALPMTPAGTAVYLPPGADADYGAAFALGYIYGQRGDFAAALTELDRAVNLLDPDNVAAMSGANLYLLRGSVHRAAGNTDAALADFLQAEAIAPRLGVIPANRADLHLTQRDYAAAITDYTAAIARGTTTAEVSYGRGLAYFETDDYDAALSDLNGAIAANPGWWRPYLTRGSTYAQVADYENALTDYNTALDLNPSSITARYGRGFVYMQVEAYGGAITDLTRVIEQAPEYADAYLLRGSAYLALNQGELALADFQQLEALTGSLPADIQATVATLQAGE